MAFAEAPAVVREVLRASGEPLPQASRALMEPRFGHRFDRVRVHTDGQAAASAQAVNALAYTVGHHVVFGAGQFAPHTVSGVRLLTHELAHVVQQSDVGGGAHGPIPATGLQIGPSDDLLEREAATAAAAIPRRANVSGDTSGDPRVQRVAPGPDGPERMGHGMPLPYVEATELAECLRIMGEGHAAYCRHAVLGEDLPSALPAPPPPPCSPVGLRRDRYLAEPGTTGNDFGLTRLAGDAAIPVVHTTRVHGGVRVDETDAALPPITSVFTADGTFTEGDAIVPGGGECPEGRYPLRWTIDSHGARRIREGEIEHCADFQHAFEISLRRYADAVNGLARSGRIFPNHRAAEAHVTRLVGAAPSHWADIFRCLVEKTADRDGTERRPGMHTPIPHKEPPRRRTDCRFAEASINAGSLPEVGRHPSSEIIRDCGERLAFVSGASRFARLADAHGPRRADGQRRAQRHGLPFRGNDAGEDIDHSSVKAPEVEVL